MIGQIIKRKRIEKNLSREDVSEKMNLGISTYIKIENNQRNPDLEELKMLTEIFQEPSPYWIFDDKKINIEHNENSPVYNQGNIYYQSLEEIKKMYDLLLLEKDRRIEEKDKYICSLESRNPKA